jgi:hypothetical protein
MRRDVYLCTSNAHHGIFKNSKTIKNGLIGRGFAKFGFLICGFNAKCLTEGGEGEYDKENKRAGGV